VLALLLVAFFVKESPSQLGQFPDGGPAPITNIAATHPKRESGVFRTSEDWTFFEAWHSPTFWMMLVSSLGVYMGFGLFVAHGVIHLRDLGYSPASAALSFSLVLLALVGGNLVVAAVGDHVDPRFLWALGSCAFGAGMLVALKATGTAGLYGYAVLLGGGYGIAFSAIMTLPSNYYGEKAYASIIGWLFPVQYATGALGSFSAGYAYDRFGSYAGAFYAVSILCFIASVLTLFMLPPKRRERPLDRVKASGYLPA
jgi:MFS family permease